MNYPLGAAIDIGVTELPFDNSDTVFVVTHNKNYQNPYGVIIQFTDTTDVNVINFTISAVLSNSFTLTFSSPPSNPQNIMYIIGYKTIQ